ncbi:MAG: carbohydrate kinase family protein [Chloroflexota bacterium]
MTKLEVVGLGALNMDCIYQVEHILDDGEAVVKQFILSPGGSAANTIYGLAKLGISTGFVGVLGDDTDGQLLIADFRSVGVDVSRIKAKPHAKTGLVVGLTDSRGKRSLYVLPGANSLLTLADLDIDYLNTAGLLHLTSFADEGQLELSLELVKKLDPSVPISFSPGMLYVGKGMKVLDPVLARTRVLFLNQDEIVQLTGKDVVTGAKTCLEHGCQVVVVTLGQGAKLTVGKKVEVTAVCYVRDAEYEYITEPGKQKLTPEDTTGAGDAFAAGFLYCLLKGKTIDECVRCGDIVAQFSMTKTGARPGLPDLELLSQRYQELYREPL